MKSRLIEVQRRIQWSNKSRPTTIEPVFINPRYVISIEQGIEDYDRGCTVITMQGAMLRSITDPRPLNVVIALFN